MEDSSSRGHAVGGMQQGGAGLRGAAVNGIACRPVENRNMRRAIEAISGRSALIQVAKASRGHSHHSGNAHERPAGAVHEPTACTAGRPCLLVRLQLLGRAQPCGSAAGYRAQPCQHTETMRAAAPANSPTPRTHCCHRPRPLRKVKMHGGRLSCDPHSMFPSGTSPLLSSRVSC